MSEVTVRHWGLQAYEPIFHAMQAHNAKPEAQRENEIWIVQHYPVFTLGLNAKNEHVLTVEDIPLVNVDRGGQVTYHGPGQIVIYLLLNVRALKMGVRNVVNAMEQAMIKLLARYQITAYARADAPGVYVDEAKIGALGLRVKQGGSYHGLSLNVDMDLRPFQQINPCGYAGMRVTQVSDLYEDCNIETLQDELLELLLVELNMDMSSYENECG